MEHPQAEKDVAKIATTESAPPQRHFDIARDLRFPFFCCGCLTGKPESGRSPKDSRYCHACQRVVEDEYTLMAQRRGKPLEAFYKPVPPPVASKDGDSVLAPMQSTCREFVHANKGGERGLYRKRGLPQDLIKQLSNDGMGTRAIATELKRVHGVGISYKTVERVVSGERVQQPKESTLPIP